ncbi:ATP-binding protein [Streptacidiphilus monticola]|uniref:ATP-binding protein n=1 Tax=Streptacidiphilus monticola TaxID=2161674 RepID=A0ABW1FW66_9ACTN
MPQQRVTDVTPVLQPAEEIRLPAETSSAQRSRRLVRSALESWGLGGQGEVVELLVGELVANAVRHAGGDDIGLRALRGQGRVRVEVRDLSRVLPCLIMGDVEDDNGRGLRIVDKLADRWGVDLLARGKSVWFELRVRPL